MKIVNQLLFSSWIVCAMCACTNEDKLLSGVDLAAQQVIRFDAPPKNIPSRVAVDAPLLGNGSVAVSIAGKPEEQTFYLARNDFWRLKSALDEAFPAVLGKIQIQIPELKGADYCVEQHLDNAMLNARFQKDDYAVYYRTYVAATNDLWVLELGVEGNKSVQGTARLLLPGEQERFVELPLERSFPEKRDSAMLDNGIQYISRAFQDAVDIPTQATAALRIENSSDSTFVLKPGTPIHLVCALSSNFKSDNCEKKVIDDVSSCSKEKLEFWEKAHEEWWANYWEKSYVDIPDSLIERQYYLSLYGLGACSRDEKFPPSIFGSWITKERPNWNGDYHLNYNHSAPYYGLYSSNRIEQADPYYSPLLDFMSRGNYYSEKVTNIPEGLLLPVGIGPLGIEPTRRSPFMDQYYQGWITGKNVEDEGMFWGQKSNSAYTVVNLSMQFYCTWDEDFTRKVYPYVKGVAHFWEHYLVKEGERYVIYNDAVHEGTVGTKNGVASLGLVRNAMQTAIDMSALLGVDADRRATWKDVMDHLSDYPTQTRNGKVVFRYSEKGPDWWGDNTVGIQHIYPAGQIGLGSDPALLEIARNTMLEMGRWQDFNGTNSFFPAAVRVGLDPDTILHHLNVYAKHTYPNGFQRGNPHGIENLSTVPNTINEMLCMGHQGIIRLFPVWPKGQDASFYHIRVEGAFLVSASQKAGEISYLKILSEKGRDLTLYNPWKGQKVQVSVDGSDLCILEGDILSLKTELNKEYNFLPVK